jgi:hypothetical protein
MIIGEKLLSSKTRFHREFAQNSAKNWIGFFRRCAAVKRGFAFIVAIFLCAASTFTPAYAEISAEEAKVAFESLAKLEGRWESREKKRTIRLTYGVTSAGSAITESWSVNGKPHSITVYSLGPDGIMATHYCRLGNQPSLKLDSIAENGTMHFRFHSTANLASPADEHLYALWVFRTAADRLEHRELYLTDGKGDPVVRYFRKTGG